MLFHRPDCVTWVAAVDGFRLAWPHPVCRTHTHTGREPAAESSSFICCWRWRIGSGSVFRTRRHPGPKVVNFWCVCNEVRGCVSERVCKNVRGRRGDAWIGCNEDEEEESKKGLVELIYRCCCCCCVCALKEGRSNNRQMQFKWEDGNSFHVWTVCEWRNRGRRIRISGWTRSKWGAINATAAATVAKRTNDMWLEWIGLEQSFFSFFFLAGRRNKPFRDWIVCDCDDLCVERCDDNGIGILKKLENRCLLVSLRSLTNYKNMLWNSNIFYIERRRLMESTCWMSAVTIIYLSCYCEATIYR